MTMIFYSAETRLNNRRFEEPFGLKYVKCLALILSALAMIGSIGMLGFGIQVLVEVSFTAPIIGNYKILYGPSLVVLIGFLTFTLTPVGFYAIVTKNTRMMAMNILGAFILSLFCILSGYIGYSLNEFVVDGQMEKYMNISLMEDYGNPEFIEVRGRWARMHQQFKCCGTKSMDDWINSFWYLNQDDLPRIRLPESCCATCETVHEKYCVAFLNRDEKPSKRDEENQTLCLFASKTCKAADSSPANKPICLNKVLRSKPIADAFRHPLGCSKPVKIVLEFFTFRICVYSFLFFIILFLSTVTWFVVHEISEPILPLRVIFSNF